MQSDGYGAILAVGSVCLLLSPLLVFYIRKWQWALLGCILYIPISGYVAVRLGRNPVAIQAKDFFFLVPAYIGFALYLQSRIKFSGIPKGFTLAAISFLLLVLLQLLNPSPNSPGILAGLVGIKVWTFYLPLTMIAYIYVSNPRHMVILVRAILISSWIPAIVGLSQYYLSTIYGFDKVMEFWYGTEARAVSFGYGSFQTGAGTLYRIPSTFSFVSQYSFFLLAAFCFSLIALEIERSRLWKVITYFTIALLLAACVTSGARFLLFSCPIALVLYFLFKRGPVQALATGLVLGVANAAVSLVTGFDAVGIMKLFGFLISYYLFDFIPKFFTLAVLRYPLGVGTGAATPQVRHLKELRHIETISVEGHFAKVIIELGIPGAVILISLMAIPLILNFRNLFCTKDITIRATLSSLLVYQSLVFMQSLKGSPLDQDPTNVYFWLSVGIGFRLNAYIQQQQQHTQQALVRVQLGAPEAAKRLPNSRYPERPLSQLPETEVLGDTT